MGKRLKEDFIESLAIDFNIDMEKMREGAKEEYTEYINKTNKKEAEISLELLDPAPDEWNFFPQQDESKILELMFSIEQNGVINPIIVWEQDKRRYMILSGHTRVEALKRLREDILKEEENSKLYKTIPAIIYGKNEINVSKAREIICDTNYLQRSLNRKLQTKIIQERMNLIRTQVNRKGELISEAAKILGIKQTALYGNYAIATQLIPEIQNEFFENKISFKTAYEITKFSKNMQFFLANECMEYINDKSIQKISPVMTQQEIKEALLKEQEIKKTEEARKLIIKKIKELNEDEMELLICFMKSSFC